MDSLEIGTGDAGGPELSALPGYVLQPRFLLWPRKVPVTILATQDEVDLVPYHQSRTLGSFTYDELRSASASTFFGRHTIVLHASVGAKAVYSRAMPDEVTSFCRFVNARIATTVKKPLGARFKLTQLEAPPDSIFSRSPFDRDEYDSAMDVLFDPTEWPDLLLDDLNKNIEVVGGGAEVLAAAPIVELPPSPEVARQPRQSTALATVAAPNWGTVDRNGSRPQRQKLGARHCGPRRDSDRHWWLDVLPEKGIRPFPALEIAIDEQKQPPPRPASDFAPSFDTLNLRETERLVSILHDDVQYARLIDIFRDHRLTNNLAADEVSAKMGWSPSDLMEVEFDQKAPGHPRRDQVGDHHPG